MNDTEPKLTILVKCQADCPKCGRTLEDARQVSANEFMVAQANVVKHSAEALLSQVRSQMADRGWTQSMCGRCRDK